MNYQAFLFDFDGVLVDSVEVKTESFAKLFESYGLDIQNNVVEYHRKNGGVTRREKFKYYYKHFLNRSLTERELEKLCNNFSSLVINKVVAAPEIPGATDLLKKRHREVKCFIVSATPDDEIKLIVQKRKIDKYFVEILGSSHSKKENIDYLLKKYNLLSEKCLFFGDTESDYKAAIACKVPFIGILSSPEAPLLSVVQQNNQHINCFKNFNVMKDEHFDLS